MANKNQWPKLVELNEVVPADRMAEDQLRRKIQLASDIGTGGILRNPLYSDKSSCKTSFMEEKTNVDDAMKEHALHLQQKEFLVQATEQLCKINTNIEKLNANKLNLYNLKASTAKEAFMISEQNDRAAAWRRHEDLDTIYHAFSGEEGRWTGADIAIVCKAFQVVERNKMFVFVLTCAKGLGIGVTELELQRVLKTDVDRAVKFQPSRKRDVPTLRTILASLDVDMSRAISSELLMRCERPKADYKNLSIDVHVEHVDLKYKLERINKIKARVATLLQHGIIEQAHRDVQEAMKLDPVDPKLKELEAKVLQAKTTNQQNKVSEVSTTLDAMMNAITSKTSQPTQDTDVPTSSSGQFELKVEEKEMRNDMLYYQ
ncbi:hypothetical protein GUITHDRAFT_147224 [Guillardia theta CCMP2712]|uniref:Uncharacterized protein n=1 Tax=Guillardia theta (strain CCMP2712) TaxID=905079 RepID=L1IDZ2_GUITC|nr:hypothetical protein GUITHDRAFT_147224 [Guillardia theta CCMP2712]EKX34448.1 hypothetical protein GUITHDRAFT_147224 [Guillardia theta CCMP2712]|eukprot:XP_005821428.1 hypothetical protein GUITHDRAFT_147224 [Guillardia theta CCMP2712]